MERCLRVAFLSFNTVGRNRKDSVEKLLLQKLQFYKKENAALANYSLFIASSKCETESFSCCGGHSPALYV